MNAACRGHVYDTGSSYQTAIVVCAVACELGAIAVVWGGWGVGEGGGWRRHTANETAVSAKAAADGSGSRDQGVAAAANAAAP